ncbi:MAG: hypothetical protein JRH18_08235 [Deltaproteobacteria bacterium]|nr:hypothetical protein [Deltaproteobacteria bacterium]MBW1960382.1 hypothetical protein [Deltaproteobacteria bacterium]MBW1993067.1 hypothetical protein [Deltaproteobacteria bacterium]MBW2151640.1 hypothetical protein [Deltaproteobacteria bacterium]
MKSLPLALLTAMIMSSAALGQVTESLHCEVFMYKNEVVHVPVGVFSPQDKIVVRIKVKQIPRGFYTFHADWYNPKGDLQNQCSYRFSLQKTKNKVLESYLVIKKASALKRLFSISESSGYNIKFYGRWKVKLYLNGEEIACTIFKVH